MGRNPLIEELFKEIEHGDEEHRKWLKEKLDNFFDRNPVERKFFVAKGIKHE